MGEWIAFWNSKHSIYVNARHRDVHYRTIARDLHAHVPADARILDYGCGDALHAELIAASASKLTLCEAAPTVRAALARRFGAHPRIEARSPEEVAALPAGALLANFRRLLRIDGLLILGDIIPPHVSAAIDAMALLRFAAAKGFLGAAVVGLVRTLASEYWRLRSRLGLARYSEAAMIEKLADVGFSAHRAAANIGHNPARMTFLARRT
jgi:hypothetical protein